LKKSKNLFFCLLHFNPARLPYCSLHNFSAPPIQRIFNGLEYKSGISAYLKGHPRIFSPAVPLVSFNRPGFKKSLGLGYADSAQKLRFRAVLHP